MDSLIIGSLNGRIERNGKRRREVQRGVLFGNGPVVRPEGQGSHGARAAADGERALEQGVDIFTRRWNIETEGAG